MGIISLETQGLWHIQKHQLNPKLHNYEYVEKIDGTVNMLKNALQIHQEHDYDHDDDDYEIK